MSAPVFDPVAVVEVLRRWLSSRLNAAALSWLEDRLAAVAAGDRKALYLAFGLTVRKTGKADLELTAAELADAANVRPGWNPRGWTVDQAARVLLVLRYPADDATKFVETLDQLFGAGEIHELVALYQGLPLYPHQAALALRCAEGLRTNIQSVFRAIAHRNPFPSEQLNDDQWNQLILKCQFVGAPLDPVVGLDVRGNAKLAKMLDDFAHERWAAHRPVSPELWRCVAPFADDAMLADLKKVLTTGTEVERAAVALALRSCPHPQAKTLLAGTPAGGVEWTWSQIADEIPG
ncbi:MAG TPA: EboA domain-containing protein [Planctomycetaceae bacterium]|nr:EboA domain-containing protein [Planctomycetaceae bacterium]